MEYLATYGWALFAIFIVLAFLVTSGVFNPSRFTPEECALAPNLPCTSYYIQKTADNDMKLGFTITNTMGFPIYVNTCSLRMAGQPPLDYNRNSGCGKYLAQGEGWPVTFGLTSANRVMPDDLKRIYVNFTFRNCADLDSASCQNPAENTAYPWHVTSGRLVLFVRSG